MVSKDERMDYGKPQPGTPGLSRGGEEWREDTARIGSGYSRAVVLNRDGHVIECPIRLEFC